MNTPSRNGTRSCGWWSCGWSTCSIYLFTLAKRTEPHIYVANWFYLAFIVTIAVLVLGNNTEIPISIYSSKSR